MSFELKVEIQNSSLHLQDICVQYVCSVVAIQHEVCAPQNLVNNFAKKNAEQSVKNLFDVHFMSFKAFKHIARINGSLLAPAYSHH